MAYPFVESPNVTKTGGRTIDLIVIHTMEMDEKGDTAEHCALWFKNPAAKVSAHYCVDADSIVQCVRDQDVAWHAPGANHDGIGIEHAGRAKQTGRDWSDAYSVAMLQRCQHCNGQRQPGTVVAERIRQTDRRPFPVGRQPGKPGPRLCGWAIGDVVCVRAGPAHSSEVGHDEVRPQRQQRFVVHAPALHHAG